MANYSCKKFSPTI